MNRRLALILACAWGLSVHLATAALTDPAQIQTEAYVNLVQADQSLDAGRLDEALSLYKTARDYYVQLARDFPGWEPRVIQYRKTYCDNQILEVERQQQGGQPAELAELPPEAEPPPVAPAPEPAAKPVPEPEAATGDRSVEIDYLKSRIAGLEAQLAEYGEIQQELEDLAAAHATLQKQLEDANRRLAEGTAGGQVEMQTLRTDLAARDSQMESLRQELEAAKQQAQAVNELEARLAEQTGQNERLNKEIKTLDDELDEAEDRAAKAVAKQNAAEERARQAKQDLANAVDARRATDKQLAQLERQTVVEKPAAPPAAPVAEPAGEQPDPALAQQAAPATITAGASRAGVAPADYVRQLLQAGENDRALAAIREARQAAPDDPNLALIEGIAMIRLQRYSEAAELLIALARNQPKNAEVNATLGAAMMGAGFYEEARETLLLAIKLDKNQPECLYNLAQLYAFIEPIDFKQARKYYRQAREFGLAPDAQLENALK